MGGWAGVGDRMVREAGPFPGQSPSHRTRMRIKCSPPCIPRALWGRRARPRPAWGGEQGDERWQGTLHTMACMKGPRLHPPWRMQTSSSPFYWTSSSSCRLVDAQRGARGWGGGVRAVQRGQGATASERVVASRMAKHPFGNVSSVSGMLELVKSAMHGRIGCPPLDSRARTSGRADCWG